MNSLLVIFTFLIFLLSTISCNNSSDKKNVEKFIETYFSSWSSKDMKTYKSLFHKDAIIHDVRPDGRVVSVSLNPFVKSQEFSLNQKGRNLTESASSVDIDFSDKGVDVRAKWDMLSNGLPRKSGYDFFTLYKFGNEWKIMHLMYFTTEDFTLK